jgi:MarR family transcriptional regulator, transcriptional regulator for hemolysin
MWNDRGVEERLGKQLAVAAKAARAEFDQALVGIGSSFHTFLVLRHVELYPGVTQRQLARHLGIEGPTLTHHLDRLCADGLVERVRGRDDRRTSSTVLTASGRAHLRRVVKFADQLDSEFRELFSPTELLVLQECLQRIIHHYGRTDLDVDRSRTG